MTISATTQGIKPGVCTSTNRPANPFDGQVIYMTDVDQTAVWDGSQWTVLAPIASGRNVVINGAMQVHQRGTSTAGITGGGYYTADRWNHNISTCGTWTSSIENDAPTGSGFRKSLKMAVTTANASPSFGNFRQVFEGQNVQQFLKGTSSAKQFTLSFWVKSNVTGTFVVEMYDLDNSRFISNAYTISAAATWEKKTMVFPADTIGAFNNDNLDSFYIGWGLGFSSTFTSGTLPTAWGSVTNANRYAGQTNVAATVGNYWQITGVQLEAGAVATPFEFEDYGTTLAKCQRYYQKAYNDTTYAGNSGVAVGGFWTYAYAAIPNGIIYYSFLFPTRMRTAPTVNIYSYEGQINRVHASGVGEMGANTAVAAQIGNASCAVINNSGSTMPAGYLYLGFYVASAEL